MSTKLKQRPGTIVSGVSGALVLSFQVYQAKCRAAQVYAYRDVSVHFPPLVRILFGPSIPLLFPLRFSCVLSLALLPRQDFTVKKSINSVGRALGPPLRSGGPKPSSDENLDFPTGELVSLATHANGGCEYACFIILIKV